MGMTRDAPSPRVLRNLHDFVEATGYGSLEGAGDYFTDCCVDCDVQVQVEGDVVMMLLGEYGRGVGFTFPFTLEEVIGSLVDIEDEHLMPIYIKELEESIELVEGFEVSIDVDHGIAGSSLPEAYRRRQTDSGLTVQSGGFDYPYKARMRGSATVEEWIRDRFNRHCLGFRVDVCGDLTMQLRALRGENASSGMVSRSNRRGTPSPSRRRC